MYIYSIIVLGIVCYLGPSIRRQSPLQNLALAYIYIIDSVINAAYTVLFALGWFILLGQHINDQVPGTNAPGGKMMNDTAGFTDPEHGVSEVEVIATPAAGVMPAQDAVAIGKNAGSTNAALGNAFFQSGSIASITVISILWLIRLYFCLIVLAYARRVLRQYILTTSSRTTDFGLTGGSDSAEYAENPFRVGREEGEGWKGKLGRIMTVVPKRYWLGKDDAADEEWVRGAGERFSTRTALKIPRPGVGERERRARSGTGPPPPIRTGKSKERS